MSVDPVTLRVVSGALRAACEEMGAVLIRAAHSANIKERRDASCALFDPAGRMVMQAEHIPVHLGAMPAAVEAVAGEEHAPDVAWVLNDPYRGGTHLPDITVITPAFAADGTHLGFAVNRAHHADVGGPTPGSMPADSSTLADEGVVIAPRRLDAARDRRAGRPDAPARAAPRRPARAARRQPHGRRADARAARPRRTAGRDGRDDRLLRAPHARLPRRAAPTARATPATSSRHARAISSCGWRRRCAATG